MRAPTETQLRAMTAEQRMTVRANAVRLGEELGSATVALIDAPGLPLSSGGMTVQDPIYLEMQGIIWSAEGRAAPLVATKEGMPARALGAPLLQPAMGAGYGRAPQGTNNAGYIVDELMRHLGYDKDGEGSLPANCVARTAANWRPRKGLR